MKSFRCGDVVPGCTATFQGSEDEVLGQVARHAAADHGMSEVPPELVAKVRSLMTDVA